MVIISGGLVIIEFSIYSNGLRIIENMCNFSNYSSGFENVCYFGSYSGGLVIIEKYIQFNMVL